jgi:hypothetical protein
MTRMFFVCEYFSVFIYRDIPVNLNTIVIDAKPWINILVIIVIVISIIHFNKFNYIIIIITQSINSQCFEFIECSNSFSSAFVKFFLYCN